MKNWILLAAICITGSSPAVQTPVSPWSEPQGAFFALSVPDADASAAWYQRHLGFQVITKGEAPDKVARGILLDGHGSLLEIVQHSKAKPLTMATKSPNGTSSSSTRTRTTGPASAFSTR